MHRAQGEKRSSTSSSRASTSKRARPTTNPTARAAQSEDEDGLEGEAVEDLSEERLEEEAEQLETSAASNEQQSLKELATLQEILNGQTEQDLAARRQIEEALEQATLEERVAICGDALAVQTTGAYARLVQEYVKFWETFRIPESDLKTSAYPIIPSKVFTFMRAMEVRPQRKGKKEVEGTQLGKGALKKYVSALERERNLTSLKFPNELWAQKKLRDDARIKDLERKWERDTRLWSQKSQDSKSIGGISERITDDERRRLFQALFTSSSTPVHHATDLRDLDMFVYGCSSGKRGDNIRMIQHSDLGLDFHSFPDPTIPAVPTLIVLSNRGKTNANGRLDQNGTWRHRDPQLCGFLSTALHLYGTYHITARPPPDFAPDTSREATQAGYGKYGRKLWYDLVLFTGSMHKKGVVLDKSIGYDAHNTAVKKAFEMVNIKKSHTTHASRSTAARTANRNNASESDIKAHGGWSEGGSFRACYQRELPISTIAGLAGFDGRYPEKYFIARSLVEVPESLANLLFPWIEDAIKEYNTRRQQNQQYKDLALVNYLALLRFCRQILFQDLAYLRSTLPNAFVYKLHPFNTQEFDCFASGFNARVKAVEEEHASRTDGVPEVIREAMELIARQQTAHAQSGFDSIHASLNSLRTELDEARDEILGEVGPGRRRRAKADPLAERVVLIEQNLQMLCSHFGLAASASAVPSTSSRRKNPPLHTPPPQYQPLLTTYSSGFPAAQNTQPLSSNSPLPTTYAPFSTTPASPPTLPRPPPSLSSCQSHPPPQPTFSSSIANSNSISGISTHQPPSTSPSVVSTLPLAPSSALSSHGTPKLILSRAGSSTDSRFAEMARLVERFGTRIDSLSFDWVEPPTKGRGRGGAARWVPTNYNFNRPLSVQDYVDEWERGLEGGLSVQELEAEWGTAWRAGSTGATAFSRRRSILNAIAMVKEARRWNDETAIRFLEMKYKTGRKVADIYSKTGGSGKAQILQESTSFIR